MEMDVVIADKTTDKQGRAEFLVPAFRGMNQADKDPNMEVCVLQICLYII